MTRRVSVGVIGLGSIAQIQHLPNLAALSGLFRITAVADISPGLNRAISQRLPGRVFTSADWQEVCSHPDVEAVLLLTSGAHEQVTEGALQAGKHVFAEKPLCLTVEGAQRLHALALARDLVLQVGYMKLHEKVLDDLRRELQRIGEVRQIRHSVYHPQDSVVLSHTDTLGFDDADSAVLAEAAAFEERRTIEALGNVPPRWGRLYRNVLAASLIHSVSFLRGVIGHLPSVAFADMWPPASPRSPTTPPSLLAHGQYSDHTGVELSWLWLPSYPGYRETFEAHGAKGSIQLRFANPYRRDRAARFTVRRKEGITRYEGGDDSPFVRELRHFHDAVITGDHPPDALGAAADISWLQDMVAALGLRSGMVVGGEAGARQ
jgi:predicted dehydrogenase